MIKPSSHSSSFDMESILKIFFKSELLFPSSNLLLRVLLRQLFSFLLSEIKKEKSSVYLHEYINFIKNMNEQNCKKFVKIKTKMNQHILILSFLRYTNYI